MSVYTHRRVCACVCTKCETVDEKKEKETPKSPPNAGCITHLPTLGSFTHSRLREVEQPKANVSSPRTEWQGAGVPTNPPGGALSLTEPACGQASL